MTPLVLLTVGTDTHPFDRAVRWVDTWAAAHPEVDVVAQWGTSTPPAHCDGGSLLPRPELDRLVRAADAVVSHGGPATLHQVREAGLLPLCLPRDPDRGEHVDDHQQRFTRHQATHGRVVHLRTRAELSDALDRVLDDPDAHRIDPTTDETVRHRAVTRFAGFVDAVLEQRPNRLDELHRDALADTAHEPAPHDAEDAP